MKHPSVPSINWRRFTSLGIALSILAFLFLPGATRQAAAQTYSLTLQWSVTNGVGHLANGNNNRGLAYSVISNQVYVTTRNGTSSAIDVFDGTAGTLLSGSTGVTGVGTSVGCDQAEVADDGILYWAPLSTGLGSGNFSLYQSTNWNTAPYTSYAYSTTDRASSYSGKRIGDTMAITGAGTNTLILFGAGGGTNYLLFSTTDGLNFTPTAINVPTLSGLVPGNVYGIAFYTNNTFIVKPNASLSYLVQFPTGFASGASPASGTVLATNTFAGGIGYISYAPAGKLMGVITNNTANPSGVYLYSLTNFPTPNLLTSTTFACPNGNGNATEGVALGGVGKTNWIYAYDSNNRLMAYQIGYTVAPVAPAITSQPSAVSGAYPPQTLAVGVSGSAPLSYQWYVGPTNSLVGATAISGATNSAYTLTSPVTNYYGVVITNVAGSVTSSVVSVSLKPLTTNSVVTQIISITNGAPGFAYLQNDDNTRGLAYDPITGRLVIANKTGGTPNLYLVNGATGATNGVLNTSAMLTPAGETFPVDQVRVADDGVVYACNLVVSPNESAFTITSWSSATTNATAYTSYSGDPGNGSGDRWGDTMAVRGAGVNTQILLSGKSGNGAGTNMILLTTGDGSNFVATVIPIPGVPAGFAGYGLAFGASNTFWGKKYGGDLFEIAFDPTLNTPASVLLDYTAGSQIPSAMVGVGVDTAHSIYGGVDLADQNNDLQLFQLTGSSNPPVLFDQAVFPNYVSGDNGNELGVVSMKYPYVYALSVDNGIIGMTYGVPASTAPSIVTQPTGATIFSSAASYPITLSVSGTLPLYYQWQYNTVSNAATATNIPGATSSSYTFSYPPISASGWYDVVVTNFGGKATSAPVLITIVAPTTNSVVTNTWSISPGTLPFLDSSTYGSRGLAYDTNSGYLLVSDHLTTNIYVLNGATGAYVSQMGPFAGLTSGTFPINLIGIGDDGVVYFADVAITQSGGGGDVFVVYTAPSPTSFPSGVIYSNDPGNGAGERWGDTMAVRGAGANTQILIGSYGQGSGPGTNVALLYQTNGNWTALTIPVAGVPSGFSGLGIAFGAGNTFWCKGGHGYDLREIAFDPTGATPATVLQDYTGGVQTPNDLNGLAVDVANNILGGVNGDDIPFDTQLYQLTGTTNPPVLFDQVFFNPGTYSNAQENDQVVLKYPGYGVNYGVGFALDVNNGIVAFNYGIPAAALLPFRVTTTDTSAGVVLSWPSVSGHTYNVLSSATLTSPRSTWTTNATYAGTGGTLSFTNTTPTLTRFYTVQTK